ncbi:unnamed protein product, partial [Didymodactylos carnosus]
GKIGGRFCDRFQMEFIQMNTPRSRIESYHYTLLLDASGSVREEWWNNLIAGVKALRQSHVVLPNVTIRDVDVTKIKCSAGRTNFELAFQLVINTLESVQQQPQIPTSNLEYIMVFMSDGEATCPETELNRLQAMNDVHIKEFWIVNEQKIGVLKRINIIMSGTFKQLKDPAELIQVYAEIAQG